MGRIWVGFGGELVGWVWELLSGLGLGLVVGWVWRWGSKLC